MYPNQDGYQNENGYQNGYQDGYQNTNYTQQNQAGSASGWPYYSNGGWQPPVQPYQPQAPLSGKNKGKSKALGITSLVLACSLAGFGGGYMALNILDPDHGNTVVYRQSENAVRPTGQLPADYSLSDIAEAAGQSVVSIGVNDTVRDFMNGERMVSGAGSGVIISEDGYIATNNHVVQGAEKLTVTLPDGSEHEAKLVGADPVTDVAVVKIDVTGLVPAVFANSDQVRVGDMCLAIGNPMGTLGGTVTDGIISALNRDITIDGNTMHLLQMSAAVSPGNSGGGLFDANGQLIGLVNAKSGGENAEGLGFAVPSNTALEIATQLIENGKVTGRPALGVSIYMAADQNAAGQAGYEAPGLYVAEVSPHSAAEKAGLQQGDRIVAVDGLEIETSEQLRAAISGKKVGDSMELTIERGGHQQTVTVVLQEAA